MDAEKVLPWLKKLAEEWSLYDAFDQCSAGSGCAMCGASSSHHLPGCELAALLAQAEQEARDCAPTISGVIEFLYGTRKTQTREEYLERSSKACEEWGPVVLYWAEEEYSRAAAKLAELGYVKSDGRDGHLQGEWCEAHTGGWRRGTEPPSDNRKVILCYRHNGKLQQDIDRFNCGAWDIALFGKMYEVVAWHDLPPLPVVAVEEEARS